ncbi:MAG TPA: dihydropyrimidinase [Bacteroidales bacterium]|nr:dihydropyrimidinase [Bacteroidales bacterium]
MKVLIKNPFIVNADHSFRSDIMIENGNIIRIAENIEKKDDAMVIDATHLYALPGGIDPHVHMELPTPAGNSSDDFYSGSLAALAGGTTSIIDFVTPSRGQSHTEAVKLRKQEAKKSLTDYSLHGTVVQLNENTEEEVRMCIEEEGITSFKTYLAYRSTVGIDYEALRRVMQIVRKYNGIVTVHCEDGDEISRLQQQYLAQGGTSPLYHALSRPEYVESDAVAEVLKLAHETNCKVYLVHISAKKSIELVAQYKSSGKIFAETCPQYLFLNESNYRKPLPDSMKYVISPPLRNQESIDALWQHVVNGCVDTIGSDHCPFDTFGQKDAGINDFSKIPNGAGGIEYRMQLLFTYGVLQNKITLTRFVELTATNAAKIFGLFPKKGIIAVGSDADIVLWSPHTKSTISLQTQHQHCDSNIYEGIPLTGVPEYVICHGKIAFANGKPTNDLSKGSFLSRKA